MIGYYAIRRPLCPILFEYLCTSQASREYDKGSQFVCRRAINLMLVTSLGNKFPLSFIHPFTIFILVDFIDRSKLQLEFNFAYPLLKQYFLQNRFAQSSSHRPVCLLRLLMLRPFINRLAHAFFMPHQTDSSNNFFTALEYMFSLMTLALTHS